eukprot:365013-Chlamydomonas_euryale.AAC.3
MAVLPLFFRLFRCQASVAVALRACGIHRSGGGEGESLQRFRACGCAARTAPGIVAMGWGSTQCFCACGCAARTAPGIVASALLGCSASPLLLPLEACGEPAGVPTRTVTKCGCAPYVSI